jgi:predicted dehydrogenase
MSIRVAVIGAGIFTRMTYIPNLLENSDRVKLTAILSRTLPPIEETLAMLDKEVADHVVKFVGSAGEEAFFARAKELCDAVLIVVPIPLLARYVELCMASGLHILSEKPVAMTSGEATELIALYRGQERTALWHVAENYRLEPAVVYARNLVRKHSLTPKSFSLIALRQQSTTSKYAVTTWRAKPAYNGSFVLDGGIHFVALLRTILGGDIRDIQAIYEEKSVVEVSSCGACRVGSALGTFQIRYGAFVDVVCRLDVYWDDAAMSIIQHKGVGYEVIMTGEETMHFPFEGLQIEFKLWLDTIASGAPALDLLPEEGLTDLLAVESMCGTVSNNDDT